MAKFAFIIIFKIVRIDEKTRKLSLLVGLEPTSPNFSGRCLNHLDDDVRQVEPDSGNGVKILIIDDYRSSLVS